MENVSIFLFEWYKCNPFWYKLQTKLFYFECSRVYVCVPFFDTEIEMKETYTLFLLASVRKKVFQWHEKIATSDLFFTD